jgi:hypothetical protein
MTVVNCVSGIPKWVGVGADGDDINRRSGPPVPVRRFEERA